MKKFISLLLILTLAFTGILLTACKEDEVADNEQKVEENKQSTPNENEEPADVIKTVTDGKLTMATNAYFQPYEYYEGEKIVGIDAEIAAAIAEYLGLELEIEDMEFDSIITAVKENSVDFGMAGMTVTEDRLLEINFTNSYATGVQVVIVPEDSAITTVDDLFADGATYKAGVQLGTTGDIYASGDLGDDRVTQYDNANNAVLALLGGSIDCVIIDNEPAKALVAANEGLKILDTSYADEDYAICVAKGNDILLEKLNEAIVALTADGTIDAIVAKYIK